MAAALPFRFNHSFHEGKQHMSPKSNYYHLLPCKSRPSWKTTRTSLSCQSQLLLHADPPPGPPSPSPGEEIKRRHVDQKSADKEDHEIKEEEKKKKKKYRSLVHLMYGEAGKFKRGLKESLSPRHDKGDWKDLFLMSFSFAVYVYISQKIVCAYCAWMAML